MQTKAQAVTVAQRAMAIRDFRQAAVAWREVLEIDPRDRSAWLGLGACYRTLGNIPAALEAVDRGLAVDPLNFAALLMRASLLERAGRLREAGPAYGNALAQAPPDHVLDAATRRALAHGRNINQSYGEELEAHLLDSLRALAGTDGAASRRATRFIDFIIGRRKNYRQEPVGYFYPGLPAIEFWEREEFPWLEGLEEQTGAITQELMSVLQEDAGEITPYLDYSDTTPLGQWEQLNRSDLWGAYHLKCFGERVAPNAARCPRTMAALEKTPQPNVKNRSPAAMFSVLRARTHIPPHTGVANTRLVVHLPLIVPDGCRFRVGNETRIYAPRTAWVFDDTIEHEAWNDSDETRIILLFDVWNPRIPEAEQALIAAISSALDEFAGPPADAL